VTHLRQGYGGQANFRRDWILGKKGKSEKPANLPNFSKAAKAAEIFRKKAKFPQTPAQTKFIEIHRNRSKFFQT